MWAPYYRFLGLDPKVNACMTPNPKCSKSLPATLIDKGLNFIPITVETIITSTKCKIHDKKKIKLKSHVMHMINLTMVSTITKVKFSLKPIKGVSSLEFRDGSYKWIYKLELRAHIFLFMGLNS